MRIDAVAYRATNTRVSHPQPFVLSPSKVDPANQPLN
ncbi:MAG: hypothetical protein JWP29_3041 [Rhodoferax sp.]|nr:hypothetical protein [Rhodoferax sp.]